MGATSDWSVTSFFLFFFAVCQTRTNKVLNAGQMSLWCFLFGYYKYRFCTSFKGKTLSKIVSL